MQETQVWSLGQEDPLEEDMSNQSSILAWKSYGQMSLADYSPWGRKRVRHCYTHTHTHTHTHRVSCLIVKISESLNCKLIQRLIYSKEMINSSIFEKWLWVCILFCNIHERGVT